MPTHRPRHGPPDHTEGPPSVQARADLAADLRREVADARLRLEEAVLRAEAHRLLGDDEAAAAAVGEQETALSDVEDRLARVVSAAVVQRDAEQVLADAARNAPQVVEPVDASVAADPPRRVPVLSGVATAVAVLGVAVAAVLGLDGANQVQVTDAATGATESPVPAGPADIATDRGPADAPPADDTDGSVTSDRTSEPRGLVPADPTSDADADAAPTGGDRRTEDPTDTPTPETDFDEVVDQLVEAVTGLGGEAGAGDEDDRVPSTDDSPSDVEATVPDEDPGGGLLPDDRGTADDGFVPGIVGQ